MSDEKRWRDMDTEERREIVLTYIDHIREAVVNAEDVIEIELDIHRPAFREGLYPYVVSKYGAQLTAALNVTLTVGSANEEDDDE